MKRITSKAAVLKRRVRTMHRRSKIAGVLYLLGTIVLTALVAMYALLDGTILAAQMPATSFFSHILKLTGELKIDSLCDGLIGVFYLILLLVAVINVLKGISKLGWLFKRRASYTNGFNRNMYAMDDLAKGFSSTFSATLILYLQIYLLSSGDVKVSSMGVIALAAGLAIHVLGGLIGGTVTLFTTADNLDEEPRTSGVFTFFVRNVIQLAVVAVILWFFAPQNGVRSGLQSILDFLAGNADLKAVIPTVVELLAWVCVGVLVKHAASETEFNRDGLDGAGMKNFPVFAFFAAVLFIALYALPMIGMANELAAEKATATLIAAATAFVGFLLNCIVKPRQHGKFDDVDIDAYFHGANTII